MSNRNPNTSGITKRWQPGYDARCLLEKRLLSRCFDPHDIRWKINTFLEELMDVIVHNRRTRIVGFGVFEWKPWNGRLPTGERVSTWSLTFKPCRHKERYNGDR